MPTCVAWGCSSRSDRGELLKVFPRKDLRRRQVWIQRVNRPGWLPTKYSALCEKHFDRDQWEVPREDGKRKLKNTAVPTIFCVEHPSEDDVVAKDHAYCINGYRQIYDNKEEPMMPIEHIKVEVDENENFASEDIEEENYEKEEEQLAEVEDIQCTPDISVYPENGEPDPIEMVDCEYDELNANMSEPVNDPLAISADDVVRVGNVNPHFKHSRKFLFVTQATKYLNRDVTPMAKGEPAASAEVPRLKVRSLQRLLTPNSPLRQNHHEMSATESPRIFSPQKLRLPSNLDCWII